MASIAADARANLTQDRIFFLAMALWIAATVLAGFGFAFAMGRSSLAAPLWVHMHALTYAGWVGFYLLQNMLVSAGAVARHRALGWLGFGIATWMLPVGIGATCLSVAAHRVPPFFTPSFFLTLDLITPITFYIFVTAAIGLRQYADWHRRLMLSGMIFLTGPAWGRLLPMPLLGGEAGIWAILAAQLIFYFGIAAGYDLLSRRKIHPAYFWGMGGSVIAVALVGPVSSLPLVASWVGALAG